MTNLNILETFRTKEELLNYFDEIGQNITEEEIEELKKIYEKAEVNNSALNLQQLDRVSGGSGSGGHYGVETTHRNLAGFNSRNLTSHQPMPAIASEGNRSAIIFPNGFRVYQQENYVSRVYDENGQLIFTATSRTPTDSSNQTLSELLDSYLSATALNMYFRSVLDSHYQYYMQERARAYSIISEFGGSLDGLLDGFLSLQLGIENHRLSDNPLPQLTGNHRLTDREIKSTLRKALKHGPSPAA